MIDMDLPIDPPDLDKYLTLEECAHQAWVWAYDVVQLQSDDEENLTYEEHHQAHRLTIRLLMDYMWTSLGITPDQEAEESLIELLQVGWLRYARENVISRTHTLERSGVIDTIDPTLKLATRGTLYQEDEAPSPPTMPTTTRTPTKNWTIHRPWTNSTTNATPTGRTDSETRHRTLPPGPPVLRSSPGHHGGLPHRRPHRPCPHHRRLAMLLATTPESPGTTVNLKTQPITMRTFLPEQVRQDNRARTFQSRIPTNKTARRSGRRPEIGGRKSSP